MTKAPSVPRAPAFQFYASDFVGSATVGTSTAEEVGIYALLLCKDWMETGFVFDEARLAIWCKVPVRTFRKAWTHLVSKFPAREVEGVPRHFNPRLEAERVKQAEFRAVQSAKGLASGESRRRNRTGTGVEPQLNPGSTGGGTGDEPKGNSPSPSPAPAKAFALARGHGASNGTRYGVGDPVPIRPHLPAIALAPPWCAECGDGDTVPASSGGRLAKVHASHCSHYVAPRSGVEVTA